MAEIFDLKLDELDERLLEQAKLAYETGRELADAKNELEQAKAKLDVVRAEVEREITENPQAFGLAKTTVSAISAAVETDKRVRGMREDLLDKKHIVDLIGAKMTALEHRKRALENLVALHGQQYFSVVDGEIEPRRPKRRKGDAV